MLVLVILSFRVILQLVESNIPFITSDENISTEGVLPSMSPTLHQLHLRYGYKPITHTQKGGGGGGGGVGTTVRLPNAGLSMCDNVPMSTSLRIFISTFIGNNQLPRNHTIYNGAIPLNWEHLFIFIFLMILRLCIHCDIFRKSAVLFKSIFSATSLISGDPSQDVWGIGSKASFPLTVPYL